VKKNKIVYIGNNLSVKGGSTTTIETLSKNLEKEGLDVTIASNKNNIFFRFFDMLFTVFKNRKKTRVVLIDTYSTLNFYYALGVSFVCRLYKIPYIPILHGGNLPKRLNTSSFLSRQLFKYAKTNVAPSEYLLEAFKQKGYHNLTFIPNAIDIKNYPFRLRENISLKLLWVRSFSRIYNPILALEILEKLVTQNIPVSLQMVGPDKDGSLDKCKKIVQEKNLPVTFTGKLQKEEWIQLSNNCDVFINTTNYDNTPISVIEAMALGLPVISTNVGGLPFLIEDNHTGLLVPPNNAEAFVNKLIELLEDSKKTKQVSNNARKLVESFDWRGVKQKWITLLK
jgi:glycosyltransferase involved in cell wall biosynthesis